MEKVVTSSSDRTIRFWDLNSSIKTYEKLIELPYRAYAMSSLNNIEMAFGKGPDIDIYCIHFQECYILNTLNSNVNDTPDNKIIELMLLPDNITLMSYHRNGIVRMWNIQKRTCLKILEGPCNSVVIRAVLGSDSILIFGTQDQKIIIMDEKTEAIIQTNTVGVKQIEGFVVNSSRNILMSWGPSNLQFWYYR